MDSEKQIVVITGATASGKSSLALELAKKTGGVVINADSMQVYRDLRVITARPSEADTQEAPHMLYGLLDGAEACNAARWADLAAKAVRYAWAKGQLPIVVGGTGLYIKSLMEGLSPIPETDPALREALRAKMEAEGAEDFHAYLSEIDPEMATRLEPSDRQRVLRAAEVCVQTGHSLARWQEEPPKPLLADATFQLFTVMPERETLYHRINQRFDAMLEHGALEEVERLKARGLTSELPVMRSLGVPELIQHLEGETTLEEAIGKAKQHSRNYAKRQLTWIRGQTPEVVTVATADAVLQQLS